MVLHSFPTRRSSDLRAQQITDGPHFIPTGWSMVPAVGTIVFQMDEPTRFGDVWTLPMSGSTTVPTQVTHRFEDRKSTRLNSSHANISYAVLCLKKRICDGRVRADKRRAAYSRRPRGRARF